MPEDILEELTEQGLSQYSKYWKYYDSQYREYGDVIDWVAVIETEAVNKTTH